MEMQSCDSSCLSVWVKSVPVSNACVGCGPVKRSLRGAVADVSHWATERTWLGDGRGTGLLQRLLRG